MRNFRKETIFAIMGVRRRRQRRYSLGLRVALDPSPQGGEAQRHADEADDGDGGGSLGELVMGTAVTPRDHRLRTVKGFSKFGVKGSPASAPAPGRGRPAAA